LAVHWAENLVLRLVGKWVELMERLWAVKMVEMMVVQ
jgi:hypothetical protein